MFFDIGSNVGAWSLANINNCDKIVAVEASPTTFKQLIQITNHKLIPLNYAVSSNPESVIFYEAESSVLSTTNKEWLTSGSSRFCNHPYTEISCKTISLDTLIKDYGMPSLIKIDVEGGEYDCISSLNQKVEMLCFEWASETNDISLKCIDHLEKLGFTQFYMQNGDNYTFRPEQNDFYDKDILQFNLSKSIPKHDWGMIWCK